MLYDSYKMRSFSNPFQDVTDENLKKGERIHFAGFDTGAITVFYREENKLILRESGGMHWSGRGEQSYYPPRYYVGTFKGEKFFPKEEIEYTRATMKHAKEKAFAILKSL